MAQLVKNPPAMWETWVRSLGWEDPLERGKATHSQYSGLENAVDYVSMGSQRVGHDWATFIFIDFRKNKDCIEIDYIKNREFTHLWPINL